MQTQHHHHSELQYLKLNYIKLQSLKIHCNGGCWAAHSVNALLLCMVGPHGLDKICTPR